MVASCAELHRDVADWKPCAIPIETLLQYDESVFQQGASSDRNKNLVRSGGRLRKGMLDAYHYFRKHWWDYNQYKAPGPIQFDHKRGSAAKQAAQTLTS